MQYYKTTVRLSGSTMNEVVKVVSAPEFLILQYIHGLDALVRVECIKKEKTNMAELRDELKGKYDRPLARNEQSVDKIFGPLGSLPLEIPEEMAQSMNILQVHDEGDTVLEAAKKATKNTNIEKKNKGQSNNLPRTKQEKENLEKITPAEEISADDLLE